ncbi:unnamed protein product [Rotaria sp. Silwood2]|nr:unnamed protein product [Rotaria sp. Silwood2]CAF3284672.1 unnamed protein product [Rotaria sp. Silwood2]CAF4582865.1 unnamed protein product [Rotaria sp. Silwood2]CAF4588519.1 unnamed protein product [Rotaria sp. Silwood2]
MLRVIQFVRSEKYGIQIPLNNVNDRLCAMLGVSSRSIDNLKKELKEIEASQEEPSHRSLRSGSSTSITDETMEQSELVSGRPKINLSDFGKDMIRYEFHLLLAERVYPTLDRMMTRLLADFPEFPIKSKTTLSKQLKQMGFVYRKTSKIKTPLKSTFFMSQRAKSWNKNQIRQWLIYHSVPFLDQYSTSELLELSYAFAPETKYIVDETVKQFYIEILRLPVRHCILNPIERCWAELKNSVRDQNTTFQLKDVEKLVWNWLYNCDSTFISSCIDHVHVYEKNFKKADQFIQEIEDELSDDDNVDNDSDLTEDDDEDQ